MEKNIKLRTHDGSNNYLEQVNGRLSTYKLHCVFEYSRCGKTSDGRDFIDPSGGPMLIVGDKIDGTNYTIKKISFEEGMGFILTLEE